MRIRPMTYDDVPAVERLTASAFYELDATTRPANWPRPERRTPERAEPWMERLRHLVEHDPGGCWVADSDGDVVGAAAALMREGMWGLSTLAVRPGTQARGLGKRLLEVTLAYGEPRSPSLICSSHDPRAIRRYRYEGFTIHPAMLMWGKASRAAIPALPHVREGGAGDLELLDDIDRVCRGHAHGVDHQLMVTQYPLRVVEAGRRRAYAYVNAGGAPYLLAATDPVAAEEALWATLAESDPDTPVEFHNISQAQLWAVDAGLRAGLELHSRGYLALRSMHPPAPYIPSGHFL